VKTVLEGIGGGNKGDIMYLGLQESIVDGQFTCKNDIYPIKMIHYMNKHEGLFLGGTSGVNFIGAYLLAKKLGPGKIIVTSANDYGSNYASKLYDPRWLSERGFEIGCLDNLDFLKEIEIQNGFV